MEVKRMAQKKMKKAGKSAGRYMVQLDPEVAQKYQKLSDESQIPIVRIVNTALKGFEPLMVKAVSDQKKSLSK